MQNPQIAQSVLTQLEKCLLPDASGAEILAPDFSMGAMENPGCITSAEPQQTSGSAIEMVPGFVVGAMENPRCAKFASGKAEPLHGLVDVSEVQTLNFDISAWAHQRRWL